MTREQYNNSVWRLRLNALLNISKEASGGSRILSGQADRTEADNCYMQTAIAGIAAIILNEQEDEERLKEEYETD